MKSVLDWRSKKYGRITGGELEQVLATFDEAWAERSSWPHWDVGSDEWLSAVGKLAAVPSWLALYREPLAMLIARLVNVAGISDEFIAAIESDSPTTKVLQLSTRMPDAPPSDPNAMAVVLALVGNLEAISHYSRTISEMFSAGERGDLNALVQALSIDSHLIALPFFQAALRLGQLSGDQSVADELYKAMRGPHRKRIEYPKLRWVEYLLRDQGSFDVCSREEIYELCVVHLGVYDPEGEKKDAKAALFSRFRTWQKEAGIQNPRFGFSAKRQ